MFAARNMLFAKAAASGGGSGITAAAFVESYSDSTDLTTYTFSVDCGAEDANRHTVIVVGHRATAARTIASATINGISATVDVSAVGTTGIDSVQVIRAANPTGTTGVSVSITLSGASQRMGIGVYRVIKSGTLTVHDTATGIDALVASMSIDIANNGCVIGGSFYRRGQDNVWTGLTRDDIFPSLDGNAVGGTCASSGIVTPAETARAVTCTNTGFITCAGIVSYS